jgi:hypothetical protein
MRPSTAFSDAYLTTFSAAIETTAWLITPVKHAAQNIKRFGLKQVSEQSEEFLAY